jgi:integrase
MATIKTVNVKFDLNTTKAESKNIKVRFDHKGKRVVLGTSVSILSDLWDKGTERPKTDKKKIKEYAQFAPNIAIELQNMRVRLDNISNGIKAIHSKAMFSGEQLDVEEIKRFINSLNSVKEIEKPKIEVIKAEPIPTISFIASTWVRDIINGDRLTKYRTFQKIWSEFVAYMEHDYLVTELSPELYSELTGFFDDDKNYDQNTKGDKIKHLKAIVNAFTSDMTRKIYRKEINTKLTIEDITYITNEIDLMIKPKHENVKVALDADEIQKLQDLDLKSSLRLDQARDIFLVGCYTALRHSDYHRLGKQHIDGDYISIVTTKTKKRVKIPIRTELHNVLSKYDYKLPKLSRQKLSKYIKEVAELANISQPIECIEIKGGIEKKVNRPKFMLIASHTARRSAASIMYFDGMAPIDIMAITGHKKLETFQKYIISDNREQEKRIRESKFFGGHLKAI